MWKLIVAAAILAPGIFAAGQARAAEPYPTRPIRMILGFPPGGSDDYLARILGAQTAKKLGEPVVIENRPGAAGNTAAESVANASPDGYTLFLAPTTLLAASRTLYPKLRYDLLKDFAYVSVVATGGTVLLTHPSVPAKSVSELVALAKASPNTIAYGSAGVASLAHLSMQLLESRTGVQLLHVPFKGSAPNSVALAAGQVQVSFASLAAALPLIQAKKVNAIAVTTATRAAALPDVPTIAESGVPGYNVTISYGVLAPKGTPGSIVTLLNSEIHRIVLLPAVKEKFAQQALEASPNTPDEFREATEAEFVQWARVVKEAGIPANY
jgi:tripartite-type tricarboxylate transporter receptor subunit TctC